MKRHICSLLVLFTVAINMMAQHRDSISVCQFVKDSFTGYGIRNAFVTVMDTTGTIIDTLHTMPGNGSHDAQMWLLTVPRQKSKFCIRVAHPEYETGEMNVEMKHTARLNSFRFPEMLLKRRIVEKEVQLEEVTIRATRVKLYYKGDTIEVDARAFRLTEGSMLESLVKSVPGCELHDNGDIYMNGRKVDYLTLNGKDFFKGNNRMMLDNLPYYTVDKLQFFNQRSERSQIMGKDVEQPDYVMNVNLKQEYNIGYIGNATMGGGTHERWLGRGFALRFTDNSRLSIFGNANNVNETRSPGDDDKWGQPNNPIGDTRVFNIGGEMLIDDKYGRYKEVLNASLLWNRISNAQRTASQQFIQHGDMFGYCSEKMREHSFALKTNNHLTLKRVGMVSDTRFDYSSNDNIAFMRSANFSAQPPADSEQVLDSIFSSSMSSSLLQILVNNVQDAAVNNGSKWTAEQKFDYHKSLPWGDDLMITANGMWKGEKEDGNSHYQLRYANGETPDDIQDRLTQASSNSYNLFLKTNYAMHFLSGWHLNVSIAHNQRHSDEKKDLYRLDWDEATNTEEILPSHTDYLQLCDAANSPHSSITQSEEHIMGSLHRHNYDRQRGRYLSFTTALETRYVRQNGTITRGENTVRPTDSRWLMKPSVDLEYQTRGWRDTYILHYNTEMRPLNLVQTADMTDTSNPLAVQKGNPNLRPTTLHNLSLVFSSRFGTHGQFVMLRTSASIMDNLVAMNSIYNSNTGAYTYMPVNVSGNWNCKNSFDVRRAMTNNRKLNMECHTAYSYIHNVDMKDNASSTVKQHIVEQNMKLEYKQDSFTFSLLGGISWTGLRVAGVDDINSLNLNYGGILQANLPWKMHLSTDIRMYSRRGYADSSMCTDNLLWNLQIDRSFLKGSFVLAAKALDLLHQISSTHSTFNSQARIETWQLSLPSYLMLSIQYKFNKNPKKQ